MKTKSKLLNLMSVVPKLVRKCKILRQRQRMRDLSLTPCFSWVWERQDVKNRFNGFPHTIETVETVPNGSDSLTTQLKQGVNERDFTLWVNLSEMSALVALLAAVTFFSGCVNTSVPSTRLPGYSYSSGSPSFAGKLADPEGTAFPALPYSREEVWVISRGREDVAQGAEDS